MEKVSVILPTYNEREIILEVIHSLQDHIQNPLEILVVDDDSPDLTWQYVMDKNIPNVRVICRMKDRGLPKAITEGIRQATGDVIVWMDADMSHHPSLVPKLINALRTHDVATGSRYSNGGKDVRPWIRRATSKTFNGFAKLLLSPKITDWSSGFVAAKRDVVKDFAFITNGYGEYCINFFYRTLKNGHSIREIGFTNADRPKGTSKTFSSVGELLKLGKNYGKEVFKLRFNRYK